MLPANPTIQDIFLTRLFDEPLVPVGSDPTPAETAALGTALQEYSQRSGPDDFSTLTGFIETYPNSPWNAALLTNLGLEYYNTGHYSKTLEAWTRAWELNKRATDPVGKALADRAVGELAYMYARLGRKDDLGALLQSVEGRAFSGPATEKITGAREGLWHMENRPEVAFRCGPFALHRIKLSLDPTNPGTDLIQACASAPNGYSLAQTAQLSRQLGLHFQPAFREKGAAFVVPCVVHWKTGHFAAIIRQDGDRYLLQDSTFGKDAWVSGAALDAEVSGYFLLPSGELERGWRAVDAQEGDSVWGKGLTNSNDKGPHGPCDPASEGGESCSKDKGDCKGMAIPRVHLMLVSLNITDEPVGYSPPVGPAVRFVVRYNQRDAGQPSIFTYSNLGPKWTFDWLSYITESQTTPDVDYYIMGGGTRTFTGFDSSSGAFIFQQLDQTRLTRTLTNTYEMVSRDGSRKLFSQSAGSIGVGGTRKVFLTQLFDPYGNTVSLTYDANLRVVAITDGIGQVTTLSYNHPADMFKITKVTDPFGRFATFEYDALGRLIKITDVIGIVSQFAYDGGDFITALTTPYGVTTFTKTENGTTRSVETTYPDGDRDRVEFNQSTTLGVPESDPWQSVPDGMGTRNLFLHFRNTYYWSKIAYAAGYPDYTKAKLYHWLHGRAHVPDLSVAAGILESVKEPLEGRVWFDYAGQGSNAIIVGSTNKPAHVGRVLDDGSVQLYTYEYNGFGNITKEVDPIGRTLSYIYAANGIDLLETRQTGAGQNELLSKTTYNSQHLRLTSTDAAGQVTTYTYNARGQVVTRANAKNETVTYAYDANGRLTSVTGALPGSSTVFTYDSLGRVRTKTDESGYIMVFDHDDLDRLVKVTFPDRTFNQYTYTLMDRTLIQDRAGRQTAFEYNSIRQMTKRTDPLNRATLFQWCKCGALKSLTDALGRSTFWRHDIQGRLKGKEYVDGSKVTYLYEDSISRLRQRVDEKLQVTQYDYNRDDTLNRITYDNATVATPSVAFAYDPNYSRLHSMTDGTGKTYYVYVPVSVRGAGQLASVDGPLPNDTITFTYDELGRRISTAIGGVASSITYDPAGRIASNTNALGVFNYTYDSNSSRKTSQSNPNGQTVEFGYAGIFQDRRLARITNRVGITPVSEFIYGYDVPTGQITSWSQQLGTQTPSVYNLSHDQVDQLTAAAVLTGGIGVKTFGYSYDPAGNRLTEQTDAKTRQFSYNALNELTSADNGSSLAAAFQWDAEHRLISVTSGNTTTEFRYDGVGRRVGIRFSVNGAEVSNRHFVWCDHEICEERTPAGAVSKRYFVQGMKVESGATAGAYFYSRDHLGSIRELTDWGGNVRASYAYDTFGRRDKQFGDLDADFAFTGMFWATETAGLFLTKFRAYDPVCGRWLSRDPLDNAEVSQGANLYAYVNNNPVNLIDPVGLANIDPNGPCCVNEAEAAKLAAATVLVGCGVVILSRNPWTAPGCYLAYVGLKNAIRALQECLKSCPDPDPPGNCEPIQFGPFSRPG